MAFDVETREIGVGLGMVQIEWQNKSKRVVPQLSVSSLIHISGRSRQLFRRSERLSQTLNVVVVAAGVDDLADHFFVAQIMRQRVRWKSGCSFCVKYQSLIRNWKVGSHQSG